MAIEVMLRVCCESSSHDKINPFIVHILLAVNRNIFFPVPYPFISPFYQAVQAIGNNDKVCFEVISKLVFSRLNSPNYLSLFSQERCSSSLIILVSFHWTCFSCSISLLTWEAQNFRCGLTSAGQKVTFLNLLPLPHWHAASSRSTWCPSGPPALFLQSCFPAG